MDAVRMDTGSETLLVARGDDAVYAVLCPEAHRSELVTLLKQVSLMQPSTP